MKQFLIITFLYLTPGKGIAQVNFSDSLGTITVQQDNRIIMLGEKMAEYNKNLATKPRLSKGFRLMLLSTNNRDLAMSVRTKLLQQFPNESIYMSFQSPYIKLRFGNFEERADADKMRKLLMAKKIVPGNIYIVADNIEINPKAIIPDN
ncbi:MAG TPA: SPOR domain-containing protein [Ferruginibacter sp.]|nr:SPOR domain-containing protein [Ferruginibacter sp.]